MSSAAPSLLPLGEGDTASLLHAEDGQVVRRPRGNTHSLPRVLVSAVAGLVCLALLAQAASRSRSTGAWKAHSLRASMSAAAAQAGELREEIAKAEADPAACEGCNEGSAGKDPPGYKHLGVGRCTSAIYASLPLWGAIDLAACAEKCSSESKCRFFSFKAGTTCSLYGSTATGACDLAANGPYAALSPRTYAKMASGDPPISDGHAGMEEPKADAMETNATRKIGDADGSEKEVPSENTFAGLSQQVLEITLARAESAPNATKRTVAKSTNHSSVRSSNRTREKSTNLSAAPAAYLQNPTSLYCWLLFMAKTLEAKLVHVSYARKEGVFGCDGWDVLADYDFEVAKGVNAIVIGDVSSQKGAWGSVMNGLPFLKAWDRIVERGRYWSFSWTVKVDPDTAFVARRLRPHLEGMPASAPCWVKNWEQKFGLLGAIEIFSAHAVRQYGERRQECVGNGVELKTGGEDGWIAGCMETVLRLQSVSDFKIADFSGTLDHCWWTNGVAAQQLSAQHPFKDPYELDTCLDRMAQ
uniref:Apple domain-containing protein n=1 Tax=Alexandrium catenella TaxID=2925 RepID=A0A7S1PQS8_ALECA|mmetsp:Transcript_106205/g.282575  ORF Transcript_106205/g.282575 Transcript_106205/m.282575 type:complete len:528 (+) Transcript_106205:72-1655(+)